MTITAVTFDFWQTLYKNRPIDLDARLRQMQADLQRSSGQEISLEAVKLAARTARDTWSNTWAREHRTLSAGAWLDVMLAELGVSLPPEARQGIITRMEENLLLEPPDVVPDVPAVLAELAQNYRLAVISDTGLSPGRVLRQILEQDELAQYFTHLTFSDELGRSKPHAQAFQATLAALDAPPQGAVHVGDLLRTDIAGAQGVGMRGVQYVGVNRDDWSMSQSHPAPEPVTPDAVIHAHTELPPLLARWNGV
ncbi:MAG: HAD family hydrolase [Anaerolineae bacterium]